MKFLCAVYFLLTKPEEYVKIKKNEDACNISAPANMGKNI